MASTNQESAAAAARNLALQQQQQQQQQDLINLIAQHFHNQFYTHLGNNSNSTRAHSQPHHSTAAYQNRLDDTMMNANRLDLNQVAHLMAASSASPPMFGAGGHSFEHLDGSCNRSQQTLAASCRRNRRDPMQQFAAEALAAQHAATHHSLAAEMNLFSALGLGNLTSNQLVLSLQQQQQSLLQVAAAATARQHGLSHPFNIQDTQQAIKSQPAAMAEQPRRVSGQLDSSEYLSSQAGSRDELSQKDNLKFSISTILGSTNAQQSELADQRRNQTHQVNQSGPKREKEDAEVDLAADNEDGHEGTTDAPDDDESDCDPIGDLESDSGGSALVKNSTTSLLFHGHMPSTPDHTNNRRRSAMPANPEQAPFQPMRAQHHHNLPPFLSAGANSTGGHFSWTVAARGKPRRGMMRRAVFSDSQRVGLEKRFQLQKYISKPDRKKLAEKLGLRDSQVKIWFQNRRMKWRNSKERELLSAGGSREQTLPTRNNPNPDLSDVGETIKRIAGQSSSNSSVSGGNQLPN